jgi:predicted Zn finger-like uncharacterized protein
MIEIQCTSCHTRYRIDERVLPDDTPTFKCSRCGHVFNADPVPAKVRAPAPQAAPQAAEQATRDDSQLAQTVRPPRPRASAPAAPAQQRSVMREAIAPARAAEPQFAPPIERAHDVRQSESVNEHIAHRMPGIPEPAASESNGDHELESDHPLNRTFGDRVQKADTGENFRFDFSDERHELGDSERDHRQDHEQDHQMTAPERGDDDRWQVGDAPAEFDTEPSRYAPSRTDAHEQHARPSPASAHRVAAALKAARPRFAESQQPAKSAGYELGHVGEDEDDMPMLGKSYASGYFVAMFFVVAIGFVVASGLISSEPVASARVLSQAPGIGSYFARPIVPAMLVALHDVHTEYRTLKGGQVALVITGTAQNVGARPLHTVQIDADLLGDGARPMASLGVYCGNELSAKMLSEMTPREIEFSQGLSPQKSFAIEPSSAAPFLMVFINPPAHAGNLRLSVSKAVAADPEPATARRN